MSLFDVLGDILLPWNWGSLLVNTNAVAKESYLFWKPLVRLPIHAFAWLAMEDGESSFRPQIVGDHGAAFGPFQHHQSRIDAIKKGCGIDIRTASHIDQLRAAHWEATEGWYRHVWPALMETENQWDAVAELVKGYEQSAMQARDIIRRVALAQQWQETFKGI